MTDTTRGYAMNKADYKKRLARIEGQVRGIARMVDEDTYCIDILTQVAAVTKALQAVSLGLVEEPDGDRLEGLGDGRDLGEHVDAVRVLVDHALQPAHLALDAPEALHVVVLVHRVAAHH